MGLGRTLFQVSSLAGAASFALPTRVVADGAGVRAFRARPAMAWGGSQSARGWYAARRQEEADEVGACEFLYGVTPVLAAMAQRWREMDKLLLQESMQLTKRKDAGAIEQMQQLARESSVPIEWVDKHTLNQLTDNRPHQGVVLQAQPLGFVSLSKPPAIDAAAPPPVWLALDEVTDAHNFGALLRSAYFLGATGIVVSDKNSAPLSPTVSKASAGAMELMQVHSTRNLVRFLGNAQEAGWLVIGAALDDAVVPADLDPLEASRPTILVLGSEGHGLRLSVLRACEQRVCVPRGTSGAAVAGAGGTDYSSLVDSLNVSVAGALLISALLSRRALDARTP